MVNPNKIIDKIIGHRKITKDVLSKNKNKGDFLKCWNCGDKVYRNKAGNYFCPDCRLMIKHSPDSAWDEIAHKLDKYGNLKPEYR